MAKKLISIITPVYNEEDNIEYYYQRMKEVTDQLYSKYNFEFIITDNCSSDKTFDLLKSLALQDNRIRVFRFSRNFGFQKSIFTGYCNARGDAAIEFDCDLQDPPELLEQFLQNWEKGYKIVYGIRKKRQEGKLISALRKIFYRLLNNISEFDLPVDAGDFMLIDRAIIDHLTQVTDHNLYIRGIIFSFGFKRLGIEYERDARVYGKSKFNIKKMVSLAIDGIISHSIVPLRISSYAGFIISIFTMLLSFYYLIRKLLFQSEWPAGFTTITILILYSISINAIFLGIIGEYLARIYIQIKNRPMTIIETSIDYVKNGKRKISGKINKENDKIKDYTSSP